MAKQSTQKLLEHCKVSPPPNSVPKTFSLPLTFFDIPWLLFSPRQPLFFYEYLHSSSHFLSFYLPKLEHSLSLTLQHFFAFAGNLRISQGETNKPHIVYNETNYVSLIVAESNGDFNNLTGSFPRGARKFQSLVPDLATIATQKHGDDVPLLAIQVTVFPSSGFSLGFAYHHVVGDERTFNNFLKTWALLCRDSSSLLKFNFPCYDRSMIRDNYGHEGIFLKDYWKRSLSSQDNENNNVEISNMVRVTFEVTSSDMERIKKWIIGQCKKRNISKPVHLSPYVLTCAFIWVCLIKTRSDDGVYLDESPNYFGFLAGGLTRLDYPVPSSYLGNCVGFGRSMAIRRDLLGEDGIVVAAKAIGDTIKSLDRDILRGAEKWISDWQALIGSELHVMVTGSPKVNLYNTDFGWGLPKKIEEISIDKMRGISLMESRNPEGGIEVGLALTCAKMEAFSSLFHQGLTVLQ